jgi:CheY-like chemotaxis protein
LAQFLIGARTPRPASIGNPATPFRTAKVVNLTSSTEPAGRILVVEDDRAVQKALRRLFEMEGYTVETQVDGRSALDSVQSSPPSAVVLDLRLPELSGLDVCKEIKGMR